METVHLVSEPQLIYENISMTDEILVKSELINELCRFVGILDKIKVSYCLIGGLAAGYWGKPRFTRDMDFTVMSGTGNFDEIIASLKKEKFKVLAKGPSQIQVVQKDELHFLADLILVEMDYQDWVVQRAINIELFDIQIPICTPEDLIILKLIASRRQDLLDIENVLEFHLKKLDVDYLKKWFSEWDLISAFIKEFPIQAEALRVS